MWYAFAVLFKWTLWIGWQLAIMTEYIYLFFYTFYFLFHVWVNFRSVLCLCATLTNVFVRSVYDLLWYLHCHWHLLLCCGSVRALRECLSQTSSVFLAFISSFPWISILFHSFWKDFYGKSNRIMDDELRL